ncbi:MULTISPECIES: hypothetical protein [Paenibacillus]|uniref:Uncharacterized protein n=1 Tax=Paenibacillus albilobatus TaxID=2716884 RepID=A0A919XDH8_9BACL|nr:MULTISPECIES: hypothetical protein [Paenibacillus]GIO30707.1 hypothetical protein J2TS6_18480 [Paenibacillus albilobatus]
MKRLFVMSGVLAIAFLLTAAAVRADEPGPRNQAIRGEGIVTVKLVGGKPGDDMRGTTWTKGDPIIAKMAEWLEQAKPIPGQTDYGRHGYPMAAELTTESHQRMRVEPAYDCVSVTYPDGSGIKTCTPAENEIVISRGEEKRRAISPDMFEWLNNGYKHENR